MLDFSYYNPTRLIFGRGSETKVAASFRPFAGDSGRVLLVYGGGSAVRSGLIGRVTESFEKEGMTVIAKGGVRPNPTIDLVREMIEVIKAENIEAVLAVGGGSDSAHLTACGIPTLCALGVRGQFNHTEREWAEEESLFERTKLLMALLSEL